MDEILPGNFLLRWHHIKGEHAVLFFYSLAADWRNFDPLLPESMAPDGFLGYPAYPWLHSAQGFLLSLVHDTVYTLVDAYQCFQHSIHNICSSFLQRESDEKVEF